MRGKANNVRQIFTQYGITPAYAGKSVRSQALPDAVRDHPRLCGEKLYPALIADSVLGSPPPMRGKVHFV